MLALHAAGFAGSANSLKGRLALRAEDMIFGLPQLMWVHMHADGPYRYVSGACLGEDSLSARSGSMREPAESLGWACQPSVPGGGVVVRRMDCRGSVQHTQVSHVCLQLPMMLAMAEARMA